MVLQKIDESQMTINIQKSRFIRTQLPFVGHLLSTDGIRTDPEKIRAIQAFPTPRNTKQLRSSLGLCNYYWRFSDKYSSATCPLTPLLQKKTRWRWGTDEEVAFRAVKKVFLESGVLIHPDQTATFYLEADASNTGVGSVLYQLGSGGDWGVIAFASKSLRGPLLNYTTTEKELLAIVFSLQKFRVYVADAKLVIRTDHKALTYVQQCKFLNERMTRWIFFLQQFDYDIEHIPGKENRVADILSRFPPDRREPEDGQNLPILAALRVTGTEGLRDKLRGISRLQRQDPYLNEILKSRQGLQTSGKSKRLAENYYVKGNTLIHQQGGVPTVAVPRILVCELVTHYHQELGHYGAGKVLLVLRQTYHWPDMNKDVRRIVRACDTCQKNKHRNCHCEGEPHAILADRIGELVCIDYYGPLPTGRGGATYILVLLDVFSKFIKLYALKKANTKATLNKILQEYVSVIKPETILSDHGPPFTSKLWYSSLMKAHIKPTYSSVRRPQANPAERIMKELGRMFRTYCQDSHASWAHHLNDIEDCLNALPHSSTGITPQQILTGKPPVRLLNDAYECHLPSEITPARTEIHAQVREYLHRRAEERYRRRRHDAPAFSNGQLVLLRANPVACVAETEYRKFNPLYDGPFVVQDQPHPNVRTLQHISGKIQGRHNVSNWVPYWTLATIDGGEKSK